MTEAVEDMFKGMLDAPSQSRTGNSISVPGDFLIEVVATKGVDGQWGKRLAIEFKVLESSTPEVPTGVTRSRTEKWGDKQALSDIKSFALAAAAPELKGVPEREKDAIATYMAFAAAGVLVAGDASTVARKKLGDDGKPFEGDPFAGLKLRLTTIPSVSSRTGNTYVKHRWSPA